MRLSNTVTCCALLTLSLFLFGCPPDGPGDMEGMGEGAGEGMGEGSGEGQGEMPVPDAADHFFVDGTRGNDTNTARRDTPLRSIQEAINRASAQGGRVFVAGGVYEETLALASAVEVRGGYDSLDWVRDRENFPTTIAGDRVAVSGDGVMNARLEGMTIMSEDATEAGGSSIAVSLTNCMEVTLDALMLFPGNGANGADGDRGDTGGAGPAGGAGDNAGACLGSVDGGAGGDTFNNPTFRGGRGGDGRLGGGDDGGDGNDAATFIAAGGSGGSGGGVGGDGSDGTDGADNTVDIGRSGDGGANVGTFESGSYQPAAGNEGGVGGNGGAGGGGGGGGGAGVSCGGGGGGGGGLGLGGRGGEGGRGGGASIGIYVEQGELVQIENTIINTGSGGAGGTGGEGGAGGRGGAGGAGGDDGFLLGGGGDGGDGGNGAPGGPGGGGGGGPVLGVVHDSVSDVTMTDTMVVLGTPGLGGMSPGGPDFFGDDGLAMETFEAPVPEEGS